MSKAVLISIHPEWCEKIASGEKTIEARKTRPKLPTPFKCYIYMTKQKKGEDGWLAAVCAENRCYYGAGSVIGEFVCDRIQKTFEPAGGLVDVIDCKQSCLTAREIISYAGGKALYFWHISDLVIYDNPKELSEFYHREKVPHGAICAEDTFLAPIYSPPQSWCYCEVLT